MYKYAELLVDEIRNDSLYTDYLAAKEKAASADLKEKLTEFKEAQIAYAQLSISNEHNKEAIFAYEKKLNKMYTELCLYEEALDFLEAEKLFVDRLRETLDYIAESIKL